MAASVDQSNIQKHFKPRLTLPRSSLLIIYKSFVRHHLNYGDIIYDQSYKIILDQKMEAAQYNAALAINMP